jgi:hypothetical protein
MNYSGGFALIGGAGFMGFYGDLLHIKPKT